MTVRSQAFWSGAVLATVLVGLSHQLSARAPDRVFEELMAEENLFKQVEVTGLLRSNRTFDISQVRVMG